MRTNRLPSNKKETCYFVVTPEDQEINKVKLLLRNEGRPKKTNETNCAAKFTNAVSQLTEITVSITKKLSN